MARERAHTSVCVLMPEDCAETLLHVYDPDQDERRKVIVTFGETMVSFPTFAAARAWVDHLAAQLDSQSLHPGA